MLCGFAVGAASYVICHISVSQWISFFLILAFEVVRFYNFIDTAEGVQAIKKALLKKKN